ncbi:MAG: DUF1295 domain-containing protein [Brevinemataceae bacterium]
MTEYYSLVQQYAYLSAAVLFTLFTLTFFIAQQIKLWVILDIIWGAGFCTVALLGWGLFGFEFNLKLIPVIFVLLWGIRLAVHLGIRSLHKNKKTEDPRYETLKGHPFQSYINIFLSQAAFTWMMCIPFFFFMPADIETISSSMGITSIVLGSVVCIWGLVWEWTADFQLAKKTTKGLVLRTGLWKYSRHPNYFGEISFWWGIWIITRSSSTAELGYMGDIIFQTVASIISPLTITLIISKLTGPMLEKLMEKYPDWEEYRRATPYICPFGQKINR